MLLLLYCDDPFITYGTVIFIGHFFNVTTVIVIWRDMYWLLVGDIIDYWRCCWYSIGSGDVVVR